MANTYEVVKVGSFKLKEPDQFGNTYRHSVQVKTPKGDQWIGLGTSKAENWCDKVNEEWVPIGAGSEIVIADIQTSQSGGKTYYNAKKSKIMVTKLVRHVARTPAASKKGATGKSNWQQGVSYGNAYNLLYGLYGASKSPEELIEMVNDKYYDAVQNLQSEMAEANDNYDGCGAIVGASLVRQANARDGDGKHIYGSIKELVEAVKSESQAIIDGQREKFEGKAKDEEDPFSSSAPAFGQEDNRGVEEPTSDGDDPFGTDFTPAPVEDEEDPFGFDGGEDFDDGIPL